MRFPLTAPRRAGPAALVRGLALSGLFVAALACMGPGLQAAPAATGAAPPPAAEAAAPAPVVSAQDDWLGITLTDVRSSQTFTLRDFQGRVVLLQTMAAWWPVCAQQSREMAAAGRALGDGVALVSIDVDPNETAQVLARHVSNSNFDWTFAVAPAPMQRALSAQLGRNVLNPPTANVILIDRGGNARLLRSGVKSADELAAAVAEVQ